MANNKRANSGSAGERGGQANEGERAEPANRVAMAVHDAQASDEAERMHRLLVDGAKALAIVAVSPDAIISIDEAQHITLWNDAAEKMFGYTRSEAIGESLDLLIPERLRRRHRAHVKRFSASSESSRRMGERGQIIIGRRKNGEEFRADAAISKLEVGGEKVLTVAVRDVSRQYEIERERTLEAEGLARIQKVTALFLSDQPLSRVLEEIVDAAIAVTGADFGNLQRLDTRQSELVIVAHRGFPQWWLDFWNNVSRGQGVCGTALEHRQRVVVEDVEQSPIFADPHTRAIQLRAGVHAVQSTPLIGRGGVPLGMISTHYKKPGRPSDGALRLLDLLARQAADILERVRTDEALRVSEARFSGILAVSPDAIISMDDNLRITLWNDGAEEIYGYSRDEAIGAPVAMIIPEPLRDEYLRDVRAFADGAEISQRLGQRGSTYVGRRKDGSEFPADAGISKLQVAGERILTVSVRDVTEQKRIEREQRSLARLGQVLASNLDYESTLTQLVQLVAEELADYAVLYLREADEPARRARVATRDPANAWYGKLVSTIRAEAAPDHPAAKAIATKQTIILAVDAAVVRWLAHTDEHAEAIEQLGLRSVMAVPLIIGDSCLGALLLKSVSRQFGPEDLRPAEEIARRTALLIENARLHRAAKAAIRARDNVLSIVAHDLRNPLGTIVMETGMLTAGEEGPKRTLGESVASIQRAAKRMKRMIRDLLDITRIESGPLSIERSRVSVGGVINDFVKSYETIASRSAVELTTDVAPDVGYVDADRDRVLQVFENLVTNAERYTPKGGQITIGATRRENDVLLWVADTGEGIEPAALPHLFERFSEDRQIDRRGTGLGLPIVKGIVEAHGGRVWAESAVGKGATFFFTLPNVPPKHRVAPARAEVKLDK